MLDLCCGTGQLALYFLERGYQVTGIDLSEHMLHYARENASAYLAGGQARFIQADASRLALAERFGLVVSTFDSLNHLESMEALADCFESVFNVLERGGLFIFDLNTRAGLKKNWNGIQVDDGEDAMIVTRGVFDGECGRAYTRISGFIQSTGGLYQRFEETVHNAVFEMAQVRDELLEIGWQSVHFARIEDLASQLQEPEKEARVFFVARK
jgi:SAM-dependent methyltransferase